MPVEWIPVQLPLKIRLLHDGSHLPITEFEVTRVRGLDLLLGGIAHGGPSHARREAATAGSIAQPITIPCRTLDGTSGELTWHGPSSWAETGTQIDTLKTMASGKASRITFALKDGTPSQVTEWLTNVPSGRIWSQLSVREATTTSKRRRGDTEVEDAFTKRSSAWDHTTVQLDLPSLSLIRFGIARTGEERNLDDVLGPGFLEFCAGPEGLPSDSLRNSVRRSLEFLFGCGFGVLGWSEVDMEGLPLRATLLSPHVAGGFGTPLPPGLLHPQRLDGIDEEILRQFIRKYLAAEQSFDLNRIVWLYLHARNAPLDMTCGYAGAAFEALLRGYYAQPEHERHSRRFSPDRWREIAKLLAGELKSLSEQEDWAPFAADLEGLHARIGDLNGVSGTKLNTLFLDDLHLKHGDVEKKALLSRNDAAHANPLAPEDFADTLAGYRALHTLLARAVFATLGVDVQYFDYSALGFPNRRLSEHQGNGAR